MDIGIIGSWTIIIFAAIVTILAQESLMRVFYERRKTSFRTLVLSCTLAVMLYVAFVITQGKLGEQLTKVLVFALLPLIISLNYKSPLIKRLVVVVWAYMIAIATRTFSDMVLLFVYQIYQFNFMWVYSLSLPILNYIAVLLLRRFKNIKKDFINSPKFWIPTIVIPLMFQIYMVFMDSNVPEAVLRIAWASFLSTFLVGVTFLMFYLYNTISTTYEEKLKLKLEAQEKDYYFAQCQLMQESAERIKDIRHDMKLHLVTARDYAINDNANEVINYLNGLLGDVGKSEVYSDTGNIAFDSIINFKLKNIAEENIKLDINVFAPPNLNIEVADVVTILGNLLDNALDAVAKVEDKIIKLSIESSKGNLFIKVDNTFDGEVKYADGKAGAEKTITTRKDGDNHGHGLKNIRKSVEKYNGHVDISHDDNVFSVGILLYVEDI